MANDEHELPVQQKLRLNKLEEKLLEKQKRLTQTEQELKEKIQLFNADQTLLNQTQQTQQISTKTPTHSIQKLTNQTQYRMWALRVKTYLTALNLFKDDQPVDTPFSNALMVEVISDEVLESLAFAEKELPTASNAWNLCQEKYQEATISSKFLALQNVVTFNFASPDMQSNVVECKNQLRILRQTFSDSDDMVGDICSILWMHNLPNQYHAVRSILREAHAGQSQIPPDAFLSALVRESQTLATRNHGSARQTTSFKSPSTATCEHNWPLHKHCFKCKPCQSCSKAGLRLKQHKEFGPFCNFESPADTT